jgi:hypothetical protein
MDTEEEEDPAPAVPLAPPAPSSDDETDSDVCEQGTIISDQGWHPRNCWAMLENDAVHAEKLPPITLAMQSRIVDETNLYAARAARRARPGGRNQNRAWPGGRGPPGATRRARTGARGPARAATPFASARHVWRALSTWATNAAGARTSRCALTCASRPLRQAPPVFTCIIAILRVPIWTRPRRISSVMPWTRPSRRPRMVEAARARQIAPQLRLFSNIILYCM